MNVTMANRITELDRLVDGLPAREREIFRRIFTVSTTTGTLVPPPDMYAWIEKLFGSVEAVKRQRVVKVTNQVTFDGALFNELRSSRPMETKENADLEAMIAQNVGDPFCNVETGTPADSFGRVRGVESTTAANIAKYDAWHSVIIFDEHNPLHLTRAKIADAIDTGLRWAEKAYEADARARFFFLMWNCLWKSGASIIHGHAQVTMTSDTHYAKVEQWRSAAAFYRHRLGSDYFDDVFRVHQALGLGFEWRGARVFAYLTPVKEKEIILIAPFITDELREAVYLVLSAMTGKMGVSSFNLALYHPPFGPHDEAWRDFPAIVRVVDRGDPMNKTADMGAMELYASSVISSDPFAVAASLCEVFR